MTIATPLTLESVQLAFHQWRQTKPHRLAPFPDHLRHQALALLSTHSPNTIKRTLRISATMFKRWQDPIPQDSQLSRQQNQHPPSLHHDFVPLSLSFDTPTPQANATLPAITIELT